MKIFEKDGKIRLQLMEMQKEKNVMLFDFSIRKEVYEEMASHIIEHLLKFKVE